MFLVKDLAHGIVYEEKAQIPVCILCVEVKIKTFQRKAVGQPREIGVRPFCSMWSYE
jgi:hypothetical protein